MDDESEDVEDTEAVDTRKPLKWGQTPWDDLSREELLREVQRLYWAAHVAKGALRSLRLQWPHPYMTEGPGWKAAQTCDIALRHAESFSERDLYRGFFRYAATLLFSEIEEPWAVCRRCGVMRGTIGGPSAVGQHCFDCQRKGYSSHMVPLAWEDLKPEGTNV